ncbi:hypothetical protein [Paenibacillus solani]|uniref:hypothetical protein n=1 Tax=Paenibacillus solani TaxID=1705565 RepID=UPI003D29AD76
MSYLMMHTTQSWIYSRQNASSAHASLRIHSLVNMRLFGFAPSDFLSNMMVSNAFDMEFHLTSNFQPNSEYDQGHVANEAEMPVSGVVMALKKAQ